VKNADRTQKRTGIMAVYMTSENRSLHSTTMPVFYHFTWSDRENIDLSYSGLFEIIKGFTI
jgi:hypothetical protein